MSKDAAEPSGAKCVLDERTIELQPQHGEIPLVSVCFEFSGSLSNNIHLEQATVVTWLAKEQREEQLLVEVRRTSLAGMDVSVRHGNVRTNSSNPTPCQLQLASTTPSGYWMTLSNVDPHCWPIHVKNSGV